METLEALAVRCESAVEPDRELDAAIAAMICGGSIGADGRYWKPGVRGFSIAPRYTASIDAAMTLAPEGWRTALVSEMEHRDGWHWRLGQKFGAARFGALPVEGVAATPALALCSAALRAHLLAQKDHTPS